MATNTYVALDKVTVSGSSTTSVTFSSIPSTYTDLVIIANTRDNRPSSVDDGLSFRFNSDSGSNYSETFIYGNGSTTASVRTTNSTFGNVRYIPGSTAATGDLSTTIIHLMNYSNTTTYKTLLSRSGSASSTVATNVNLWRSTSAVNQITFYGGSPTTGYVFTSGSTFSLYGIAAEGLATGGYVISDADYYYHIFKSSGTFTPKQSLSCDYLVVAGGGGGGSSDYIMAGGGAGGLRSTVGATGGGGTLESKASLTSGTAYTITVGAGGAGNANGSNSSISGTGLTTITSIGGGYGAGPSPRGTVAQSGGSGGGGCESVAARGTGGAGTTNQGYAGGNYTSNSHTRQAGGGGAGAVGGASGSSSGGNGGNGVQITALATPTGTGANSGYYAGGGGGGEWGGSGNSSGGLGGGADGSYMNLSQGPSGVANTGGGGGGGAAFGGNGGSGGSGIVIIRYAKV